MYALNPSSAGPDLPLPRTVSSGLSLWLELKDRHKMGELLQYIDTQKPAINQALAQLHYVHFARFLPTLGWDSVRPPPRVALQVITEFDGDFDAYVLDFVLVIGKQFDDILRYVKNAPPLPVKDHPAAFMDFVRRHNVGSTINRGPLETVYSAYPERTVIDIIGSGGVLPSDGGGPQPVAVDRSDVQANVLKGLPHAHALHVGLRMRDPAGARAFLRALLDGSSGLQKVTNGTDRLPTALTVGFTYEGLDRLGLSKADDDAFHRSFPAFVRGPEHTEMARHLGDVGDSDPARWQLGGNPRRRVHLVLSLFADDEGDLASGAAALEAAWKAHGLNEITRRCADVLFSDDPSSKDRYVHFGYVDSLAQPRLAIADDSDISDDMQPRANVGEFLLGAGYPNVYGGANSLGGLSAGLAQNATFAALRILRQDVLAFERLLDEASARYRVGREWLAARLMGRWRDGTPLAQSPDAPLPADAAPGRNAFDYAPSARYPWTVDDATGLRCPVGAHARRMNPRSAAVAGKPYSRRLLRRGMPYGKVYQPGQGDDGEERGLVGLFVCADLDRQFEFMLRQWGQGDQAASGVRGQQDPIIGAQATLSQPAMFEPAHPMLGTFRIPRGDGQADIVLDMPRLVSTVGAAYLFMPGMAGLAGLCREPQAGMAEKAAPAAEQFAQATSSVKPARGSKKGSATKLTQGATRGGKAVAQTPFDPEDPDFLDDPFAVYARYRARQPVVAVTLKQTRTVWVLDDENVKRVTSNPADYPRKAVGSAEPQPAGVLQMDGAAHDQCRAALQPLFMAAYRPISAKVDQVVADQYAACLRLPQPVDWISAFAEPIAHRLFFGLFGLDGASAKELMAIADLALKAVSPTDGSQARSHEVQAAVRRCALKLAALLPPKVPGTLFNALLPVPAPPPPLPPPPPPPFDPENGSAFQEQLLNAAILVMAGVRPAQWAIGLATWHLLADGGAPLNALKADPKLTDRAAAEELMRYDTSTPMSLRHAAKDGVLGGVTLQRGDRLMVCWASASRDEKAYGPGADTLDFTRGGTGGAGWAFGTPGGGYECLGRELVLQTLAAVVRTLRQADPMPSLPTGTRPGWTDAPMFRAMAELTVCCA